MITSLWFYFFIILIKLLIFKCLFFIIRYYYKLHRILLYIYFFPFLIIALLLSSLNLLYYIIRKNLNFLLLLLLNLYSCFFFLPKTFLAVFSPWILVTRSTPNETTVNVHRISISGTSTIFTFFTVHDRSSLLLTLFNFWNCNYYIIDQFFNHSFDYYSLLNYNNF